MRVIAGSARRLLLKTIDGVETRPTTDRIKETLFNILQPDLYDRTFLDLFSGSGGIGIEALSRGAAFAYFVENNKKAVECIRDNLKFTHLDTKAKVLDGDALVALQKLEQAGIAPLGMIFMDPPYNRLLEKSVLEYLSNSSLIDEDTLIIAETSLETETDYLSELGFTLVRTKEYKTNKHLFIAKGETKE